MNVQAFVSRFNLLVICSRNKCREQVAKIATHLNAQALEKALTESATKRFPIIVWKPFKRRGYNPRLESMWTEEHQEQHNTRNKTINTKYQHNTKVKHPRQTTPDRTHKGPQRYKIR